MMLLSFDIEEFDIPLGSVDGYSLEDAMEISASGTTAILELLREHQIVATFFCTLSFAEHEPELIKRIIAEGHEIASHGCCHSNLVEGDIERSKNSLEQLFGVDILGYREPRMGYVSVEELSRCGYLYNASLNPTFIVGRYSHLTSPRIPFRQLDVWQIPASVTPILRIPLFWLSLHNFPLFIYKFLSNRVLQGNGCFVTYFHPWEFYPLHSRRDLKIPYLIHRNSGEAMISRLGSMIVYFKSKNKKFTTFSQFVNVLSNRA